MQRTGSCVSVVFLELKPSCSSMYVLTHFADGRYCHHLCQNNIGREFQSRSSLRVGCDSAGSMMHCFKFSVTVFTTIISHPSGKVSVSKGAIFENRCERLRIKTEFMKYFRSSSFHGSHQYQRGILTDKVLTFICLMI